MRTLIRNGLVLLYDASGWRYEKKDIVIRDNRIEAVVSAPAAEGCRVIDASGMLVMPGLINAHTHSYMSFMRNCADDLSFMDWLFGRVDPIEQKMTDEDAYWGASLAIL